MDFKLMDDESLKAAFLLSESCRKNRKSINEKSKKVLEASKELKENISEASGLNFLYNEEIDNLMSYFKSNILYESVKNVFSRETFSFDEIINFTEAYKNCISKTPNETIIDDLNESIGDGYIIDIENKTINLSQDNKQKLGKNISSIRSLAESVNSVILENLKSQSLSENFDNYLNILIYASEIKF